MPKRKPLGTNLNVNQGREHAKWRQAFLKKRMTPREVLELGTGPHGKKAVDLALKHSRMRITASDHLEIRFRDYLEHLGVKHKPGNLVISVKDALLQLKSGKPNQYSHIYAHFLLQHLSYEKRNAICKELMRTLKPGARFATVEQYHVSRQIPSELRKAGFEVSVKPFSIEQAFNLGTESSMENAMRAMDTERTLEQARTRGGKAAEDAVKNSMINGGRWQQMETAQRNGDANGSRGAKEAVQRIMEDEERQFTHSHFFVITAKKPLGKKVNGIYIPNKAEVAKYSRQY
ncbi:MAG: class I SAM-dependent methyltransferase [archaeon]|jgi:ubiquinone/menaquinone biosynthesis C-methylase UbiE